MTLKNICTAYGMYMQDVAASSRACVEEGGGVWVGLQEMGEFEAAMGYGWLAIFNTPSGSTLKIKTCTITPQLVRDRIAESEKLWSKNMFSEAAARCRADADSGRTA